MASWSLPLTYGMYALFAALSLVYVALRIPETKGMELEQTETLFVRRTRARPDDERRPAPRGVPAFVVSATGQNSPYTSIVLAATRAASSSASVPSSDARKRSVTGIR